MPASSNPARPDLALFIPSYAGGGGERIALFLVRTLAEAGLRVDLVVACAHGELRDEPVPGVTKVELGAVTEILAAPAWVRYLKRVRPRCAMSMVHTANFVSGIGAFFATEVPVIVNLRIALRCDPAAQWWFRRWFGFAPERFLYRRAARVIGVSQGVADEAAEIFDVPPNKVVTIPNPRRSRDASLEIAPEHEPLFEKPVVLGIGRLAGQKDFGMLLGAFADVTARRDLHLVILGDGPDRASLEAQARQLGLSERVFFPGFVNNPQAYLRRARVFALSSRNEGFPGALIEAMEAGAAIVSTDCDFGPREILDDDRFGRLVPVGDASSFAAALEAELDEPDVGSNARRPARADWLRRFEPEVITGRYFDLVREVIEEADGGPSVLA
ncbi:MAG: glycosyltransferase [Deltaproteobacteria bacterium]|nr:glycosyltransferase [Deltaproteobacteria bacterium]